MRPILTFYGNSTIFGIFLNWFFMTSYALYSYEETSHLTLITQKVIDVGLRNLHIRVSHAQISWYVSFKKTEV
jgi:hypothetical protein